MSLRLDEIPAGTVIRWRGEEWAVAGASATALRLTCVATGKRRRIAWGSAAHADLGRTLESLWVAAQSHCRGQARRCHWCARGFDTAVDAGAIGRMRWHDD